MRLESSDLTERLQLINNMLVECMKSNKMDSLEYVGRALLACKHEHHHIDGMSDFSSKVAQARVVARSPLQLYTSEDLLPLMGTRQVHIVPSFL